MNTGSTDVIVVGAGMAGAAAALKLAKAGKSVLIIEARDRCGGRGFMKSLQAMSGPKFWNTAVRGSPLGMAASGHW